MCRTDCLLAVKVSLLHFLKMVLTHILCHDYVGKVGSIVSTRCAFEDVVLCHT